jgi:hypothetical protein
VQALVAFVSAAMGGIVSMILLRILHNWAYRTQFPNWLRLTALHSLLMFGALVAWFWEVQPELPPRAIVTKALWIAIFGAMLSILLLPWGFVLIISGQAFITSFMATAAYIGLAICLSNRNKSQ